MKIDTNLNSQSNDMYLKPESYSPQIATTLHSRKKDTFRITIKYEAQVPGRAKKEPPTITINIFLTFKN